MSNWNHFPKIGGEMVNIKKHLGVSKNRGTLFHTPKWSFLVGKPMEIVGETHHLWKHPFETTTYKNPLGIETSLGLLLLSIDLFDLRAQLWCPGGHSHVLARSLKLQCKSTVFFVVWLYLVDFYLYIYFIDLYYMLFYDSIQYPSVSYIALNKTQRSLTCYY